MAQILDPLPTDNQDPILCCYINATSQIQIVRITNIQNWYFERVVFPGQRLVFESMPEAVLEIHSGMMASAILTDKITCDRLQVQDEAEVVPPPVVDNKAQKSDRQPQFEMTKLVKETLQPVITLA